MRDGQPIKDKVLRLRLIIAAERVLDGRASGVLLVISCAVEKSRDHSDRS